MGRMKTTSILVDEDHLALAKAKRINVSEVCRKAIAEAIGRVSGVELDRQIDMKQRELDGLREVKRKEEEKGSARDVMVSALRDVGRPNAYAERENIDWLRSRFKVSQEEAEAVLLRAREPPRREPEVR